MLSVERSSLGALPERSTLGVYLREDRKVGRDGSRYGVPWSWSGNTVQVGVSAGMVELWSGEKRLAVALALRSIENGYGAYFVRAHNLMEDLRQARAEGRLDRHMRVYLSPKVLIVDEFGIWPYDRESAAAFFSLVSARYERGSTILTSNKGFADWGELLGDTVIATAILDRLLHHSHVLNIRGESYRLKDKRQAGLLTSHRLLTSTPEEIQMEG